jgi:hypothetical protein
MVPAPKKIIRLSGLIGEDRQLKVTLPDEIPSGPVELTILVPESHTTSTHTDQLDLLRRRLEAHGHIQGVRLPTPTVNPTLLTDKQLMELGTLPPHAKPSHELINEDREDRV